MTYTSIRPGKEWLDTDGNPIQAHGGSVLYHKGIYYFYGENKEHTDPETGVWHYGVNCYSSKDLYNWKKEGIILEPSKDMASPLHPRRIMDRPHIIYNEKTKKFVMWVKFAGTQEKPSDWRVQYMGIAVSDNITEPFTLVKTIRPLGISVGDFDLFVDKRDGKAYFIAGRVHTEVVIADLTEDYMDVTGYYSSHFSHPGPPTAREAPAFFKKKNDYYLLTSGTTGYQPNPTEVAHANLMHGPWEVLGNPCVDDCEKNSFNCQFSSVFRHPDRRDLFIAVGDRWMEETREVNGKTEAYTRNARYVWLPIRFVGEHPYICWTDEWRIEDYPITEDSFMKGIMD